MYRVMSSRIALIVRRRAVAVRTDPSPFAAIGPDPVDEAVVNAWRHPVFRRYQVARIFTVLALQIQGVAIGWQVYSLTH